MVAGSAGPLEAAARIAWVELNDWMVADYGFDRMKAYHFLGQVGQMRLGNMVDPKYTMVAKCPGAISSLWHQSSGDLQFPAAATSADVA